MNCTTSGFPVFHYLLEFAQVRVHWVGDIIEPAHPLLPPSPLPLIFPSIRVFFNESALCIRWSECTEKYCLVPLIWAIQINQILGVRKYTDKWQAEGRMVWWGEGIGSWCLIGTEFQFRKVKNLGDGWWWELHNSVTEININIVKIVCFTVCDFYQHRKHSKNHLYLFLLFIYFIEVYLIYSVALVSGAQQYATDIIPLILALVQSSWIGQK